MTTRDSGRHVCGCYGCEQPAVAWVRFEGIDIDRDERGCFAKPFTADADMCQEHLSELERDVERGEAYILEQTEYVTGSHWSKETLTWA